MRRAERKGLGWSDGLLRWSRPQLLKRLHRVSETIDLNERFLQERCHNGVEAIRVVKRNHVGTIAEDPELRVGNVMEDVEQVYRLSSGERGAGSGHCHKRPRGPNRPATSANTEL